MQWLSQNWVWALFFVGFIAMHLFGHGGHGGHGSHGGHRDSGATGKDSDKRPASGSGHQH